MVARMTGDRQTYAKVGDDWVPVIHVLNLQEGDTVELAQMRTKGVYQKVGDDWVPVATLIDSAGDPVNISTMSLNLKPYVETTAPNGIVTAQTWPVANTAFFYRVRVSAPITVSKIVYPVGTASGNVDGGIYTSPDGGANLTRVASSGSVAAAGANAVQELTLTAPYELVPGVDYWIALAADNTTITVHRATVYSGDPAAASYLNEMGSKSSSFPLPASVATLTATNNLHRILAVP